MDFIRTERKNDNMMIFNWAGRRRDLDGNKGDDSFYWRLGYLFPQFFSQRHCLQLMRIPSSHVCLNTARRFRLITSRRNNEHDRHCVIWGASLIIAANDDDDFIFPLSISALPLMRIMGRRP